MSVISFRRNTISIPDKNLQRVHCGVKRFYGVGEPMNPQSVVSAYWPFQKPFFPPVRVSLFCYCCSCSCCCSHEAVAANSFIVPAAVFNINWTLWFVALFSNLSCLGCFFFIVPIDRRYSEILLVPLATFVTCRVISSTVYTDRRITWLSDFQHSKHNWNDDDKI